MQTISISASEYMKLCRSFLESVKRRPLMFFTALADLETLMHGHGVAFLQLGVIADRSDTFNWKFGDWLAETRGSSVAAGWTIAVEEIARKNNANEVETFFDILEEFFDYSG